MIRLIPDRLDTDRQYERYHHYDLADMEAMDLLDELFGIRSQMWFLKSDRCAARIGRFEQARRVEWLRERTARIQAELAKRRPDGSFAARKPKPRLAQGVKL